jgi:3-oxoacyl-[acyl-carrier-protein] synthase III
MATTIEGISLVQGGWRTRRSALRLAVAAARDAIHDAGLKPADADLLINAGIYHDRNLGEPALAPLIQADAGINPEDPHAGGSGTFSFDIANGGCGVLTALQIADGLLRSGTIGTAVIVAADADPGAGLAVDFPFSPAAGALVCQWTAGDQGLSSFRWHNRPDGGASFRATIGLCRGQNVLTVNEDPTFAERAGRTAVLAARDLLTESGMSVHDLDFLVASPAAPAFTKTVGGELGISDERIISEGPALHTVAFVAALESARRQRRLSAAHNVLFVCGAPGVTAGAALYRP